MKRLPFIARDVFHRVLGAKHRIKPSSTITLTAEDPEGCGALTVVLRIECVGVADIVLPLRGVDAVALGEQLLKFGHCVAATNELTLVERWGDSFPSMPTTNDTGRFAYGCAGRKRNG